MKALYHFREEVGLENLYKTLFASYFSKQLLLLILFHYLSQCVLKEDSSFGLDLMNELNGFFRPFAMYYLAGGTPEGLLTTFRNYSWIKG